MSMTSPFILLNIVFKTCHCYTYVIVNTIKLLGKTDLLNLNPGQNPTGQNPTLTKPHRTKPHSDKTPSVIFS